MTALITGFPIPALALRATARRILLEFAGEDECAEAVFSALFFEFACEKCLGIAEFKFLVLVKQPDLKLAHQRFVVQSGQKAIVLDGLSGCTGKEIAGLGGFVFSQS